MVIPTHYTDVHNKSIAYIHLYILCIDIFLIPSLSTLILPRYSTPMFHEVSSAFSSQLTINQTLYPIISCSNSMSVMLLSSLLLPSSSVFIHMCHRTPVSFLLTTDLSIYSYPHGSVLSMYSYPHQVCTFICPMWHLSDFSSQLTINQTLYGITKLLV